jgi:hypothetical protein
MKSALNAEGDVHQEEIISSRRYLDCYPEVSGLTRHLRDSTQYPQRSRDDGGFARVR